ncbi:hypothetical protein [Streptomyces odontomachi]|uniref:hypothetical protein n=1 Tax=Streptomyces odontomachi TaxID=2944940 RepID=UPI00210A2FAE|nr:hypothetical protein [Streptomyces sp. ODS25]
MRVIRAVATLVVVTPSMLALQGCNPHQYDSVPSVSNAKRSEIVGVWRCVEGTEVVLNVDGSAAVAHLDGQEFDFDDGWRMSGIGTWRLTDAKSGWGNGQHISVRVTQRMSWEERHDTEPGGRVPADARRPAPKTYTWTLEMQRGAKGLRLFFLFGDPDSRSYYYLEKERTEHGSSPSASRR